MIVKSIRLALLFAIASESPQLRWWAVVSATDDATGAVTLYVPPTLR